jgi:hypothetical protein
LKHRLTFRGGAATAPERLLIAHAIDRLDQTLDARSRSLILHVFVERSPRQTLYRVSLVLNDEGCALAAQQERNQAGPAIRSAFAELRRMIGKRWQGREVVRAWRAPLCVSASGTRDRARPRRRR